MMFAYSLYAKCSLCGREVPFTKDTRDQALAAAYDAGWYIDDANLPAPLRVNICPDCNEFHTSASYTAFLLLDH